MNPEFGKTLPDQSALGLSGPSIVEEVFTKASQMQRPTMSAAVLQTVQMLEATGFVIPLVESEHPALRAEAKNTNRADCVATANKLMATCDHMFLLGKADPAGMAANQIGELSRVFVYRLAPSQKWTVCIDPKIIRTDTKTQIDRESCLSFPRQWVRKERYAKIKVEYLDLNGNKQRKFIRGWEARIFQHELDHLNGICII